MCKPCLFTSSQTVYDLYVYVKCKIIKEFAGNTHSYSNSLFSRDKKFIKELGSKKS